MKQTTALVATLATLVALATPALAAGSPDAAFMAKAAQGGMTEVKAGQMAIAQGGATSKKFGAMMVKDHTKAGNELKGLAAKLGVPLPAGPTPDQLTKLGTMKPLKGAAFDSAYMTAMNKDHVDTIALFQDEASNGKDAQVKAWAKKTLPTLKGHLKMDQDMLAKPNKSMSHM